MLFEGEESLEKALFFAFLFWIHEHGYIFYLEILRFFNNQAAQ